MSCASDGATFPSCVTDSVLWISGHSLLPTSKANLGYHTAKHRSEIFAEFSLVKIKDKKVTIKAGGMELAGAFPQRCTGPSEVF